MRAPRILARLATRPTSGGVCLPPRRNNRPNNYGLRRRRVMDASTLRHIAGRSSRAVLGVLSIRLLSPRRRMAAAMNNGGVARRVCDLPALITERSRKDLKHRPIFEPKHQVWRL